MTARTVHVEHCMGTVFTIDVRGRGLHRAGAVADVVTWLHRVDAVFSTFRPDRDLRRIRRGELAVADADPDVAEVLGLCERSEAETGGYFTGGRPGAPDPTGLEKGWAVERASALLRRHGSRDHAVNGGGDVRLAGEAAPGKPWRVGISDPAGTRRILAVVTGRDFAVATSGTAERGAHIVNPVTGAPAGDLAAVTVTGPSLTRADAYATAAVAMGTRVFEWAPGLPGHEVFVVDANGGRWLTPGHRTGTQGQPAARSGCGTRAGSVFAHAARRGSSTA